MGFGLLTSAAWVAFAFWTYENDPMTALPAAEKDLEASIAQLGLHDARRLEHVVLQGDQLGGIGLTISFPEALPPRKLPVLIVLGGLGNGEKNIDYLKNVGDNVLVGYDWPLPNPFPKVDSFATRMDLASRIPDLYHRVMRVPGQVASAIDWIDRQPWADSTHISMLGFSLGALVAPSSEAVAEHSGLHVGWTVIAYGGAPFGGVLAAAMARSKQHAWYDDLLPPLVDLLLSPLEPTTHLPHLEGRFLVLEGQHDERFPEALRTRLREAVPDPKEVIVLEGQHLGLEPDKLPILDRVIQASTDWLIGSGAANAP
jgi:dienelactone hydrolase